MDSKVQMCLNWNINICSKLWVFENKVAFFQEIQKCTRITFFVLFLQVKRQKCPGVQIKIPSPLFKFQ